MDPNYPSRLKHYLHFPESDEDCGKCLEKLEHLLLGVFFTFYHFLSHQKTPYYFSIFKQKNKEGSKGCGGQG